MLWKAKADPQQAESAEETPDSTGQGPAKRSKSTAGSADDNAGNVNGVGLPSSTSADPAPPGGSTAEPVAPPPGLENAPPLSDTVKASFASAANGVATNADDNKEGKVVVNGS